MPDRESIEALILSIVGQRGPSASACPSEVARALSSNHWRDLMPQVRETAWRLQQQGLLDIAQGGVSVLNPKAVRGPIRIRLPRTPAAGLPIGETP